MASVFMWSVSNTGGIRTFFNLRAAGLNLEIFSFSISKNISSSNILLDINIIKKNLFWYILGLFYKFIPDLFF